MHSSRGSIVSILKITLLPLLMGAVLLCIQPAHAQEGEPALTFGLRREFGYALGSSIQGTFSVRVDDDQDLAQIALLIDGQQINIDDEPPFRIRFSTSEFSPGVHSISVIGLTTGGQDVASSAIEVKFLSSEQARTQTVNFVVPLLAIVLAVMLLSSVLPALLGRRKRALQPGSYGPAGGTVCPRCGLPFSRNFLSPNLLLGKLERCPHCGKWGLLRRASGSDLETAEARLAATLSEGAIQQEDDEAQFRRLVDESRYEGNE